MSMTKHSPTGAKQRSPLAVSSNLGGRSGVRSFSRSKYGNRKTVVDGITFDSAKEAKRWAELKLLKAAGTIDRLERQVRYDFDIDGVRIGFYKADFRYLEMDRGYAKNFVVEDVKGVRTAVYRLKKKLMKALYHIDVVEI